MAQQKCMFNPILVKTVFAQKQTLDRNDMVIV